MEMMESIIVEGDVQQMEVKYIHVEEGTLNLKELMKTVLNLFLTI